MFVGQVDSSKRLNLLYDEVERHYHVIANLTGAMGTYVKHATNVVCVILHMSVTRRNECNRYFRSRTCFANHKQSTA